MTDVSRLAFLTAFVLAVPLAVPAAAAPERGSLACIRSVPRDVCGPRGDLVMAGGFMACLSLPSGAWFCRPKADLYLRP